MSPTDPSNNSLFLWHMYSTLLASRVLWRACILLFRLTSSLHGPAGGFGGLNPVVGCRAFGALPVNSVRVYGGSRRRATSPEPVRSGIGRGDVGFTEPGCELADFGGPFASSVEANNWLHFVYGTAEGPLLWKKSEYSSACIMDSQLRKRYVGDKSWPQCKTSNALCWLVMALEL